MTRLLLVTFVLVMVATAVFAVNHEWQNVPSPPAVIGEVSAQELMNFLQGIFPNARPTEGRGGFILIKGATHQLVSLEEMRRFLAEDKTNEIQFAGRFVRHYLTRLRGQMSTPGWERVAFGAVYWQNDSRAIFVTRESGRLAAWLIHPGTDEVVEVSAPDGGVRFVDID